MKTNSVSKANIIPMHKCGNSIHNQSCINNKQINKKKKKTHGVTIPFVTGTRSGMKSREMRNGWNYVILH